MTSLIFAQNTNLGNSAGYSGSYNTSIGYKAGDVVTGLQNTFLGHLAGSKTTNGLNNVFLGSHSGLLNTSGYENIMVGSRAGYNNTTGYRNIFIGQNTGYSNTSGIHNAFIGYFSGWQNTYGYHNTVLGSYSGYSNTSGHENTFVGFHSGYKNTNGDLNTFIGSNSGRSNTTGLRNVFLGNYAGYKNTSGQGNVFLGNYAGYNNITGSNQLFIDNSSTSTPLIYGNFNTDAVGINTTATNGYTLSVNGKIRATEVRVYTGWADYVFEHNYKLRSLREVETYIQQNKHLPDVPSAKVVEKEGILIGKMNATLLRKIEELTLYMIEANKAIKTLQEKVEVLQKENKTLKDNK